MHTYTLTDWLINCIGQIIFASTLIIELQLESKEEISE